MDFIAQPLDLKPWTVFGWCDSEGRCWWGRKQTEYFNPEWFYATYDEVKEYCDCSMPDVCAPYNTIPVP